jgi:hypothetical protein
MAVLFNSDLHTCKMCNRALFEEVTLKSYNKVGDKILKVNSAENVLKCVHCGHFIKVGAFGEVQIQE